MRKYTQSHLAPTVTLKPPLCPCHCPTTTRTRNASATSSSPATTASSNSRLEGGAVYSRVHEFAARTSSQCPPPGHRDAKPPIPRSAFGTRRMRDAALMPISVPRDASMAYRLHVKEVVDHLRHCPLMHSEWSHCMSQPLKWCLPIKLPKYSLPS